MGPILGIVFGLRESFNDFLKDANSKSGDIPAKLDDLASIGIRLVISDKADPDGVGFAPIRGNLLMHQLV